MDFVTKSKVFIEFQLLSWIKYWNILPMFPFLVPEYARVHDEEDAKQKQLADENASLEFELENDREFCRLVAGYDYLMTRRRHAQAFVSFLSE